MTTVQPHSTSLCVMQGDGVVKQADVVVLVCALQLNELSMMHKNRQFVLHVSPLPGTSTPVPIDSVRSEPFEVVTGRLRIIGDLPGV